MSFVVTGASGKLGSLVVEALLRRGVPAGEIIASGRDTDRLTALAARGVVTRRADFADPASLETAFAGATKLLLVSTTAMDERVDNHRRAIDAAVAAGVSLIAYTSMVHADTATNLLAVTHRATEDYLASIRTPTVALRNSWYLENYTEQLPAVLEAGALVGAAGHGKVSAATRADYAEAAAAVLTAEHLDREMYELGGDDAFTLTELAAIVAASTGKHIVYNDLAPEELARVMTGAGVPADVAAALVDADLGLRRGELYTSSRELSRLIGRSTTSPADAVAAALR